MALSRKCSLTMNYTAGELNNVVRLCTQNSVSLKDFDLILFNFELVLFDFTFII